MKWRVNAIAPAFVLAFAASGSTGAIGVGDAEGLGLADFEGTAEGFGLPPHATSSRPATSAARSRVVRMTHSSSRSGRCDGNYPPPCLATPAASPCGQRDYPPSHARRDRPQPR